MAGRLLTIPQPATAQLRPAQRKFNQLQQQIAKLREALRAWDEAGPVFAKQHAEKVLPLRRETEQRRREIALRLDEWLAEKGWPQGEREAMRLMLCELCREALELHLPLDDAERERWKALHDAHADMGFDAENQAELEVLKKMFERQAGVDLGDARFDSEAELLAEVREQLRQRSEQAAEEGAAAEPPPKRQSAKQKQRAAEREAVAAQARASLREVFRKLASSLHPDRASDAADAERRTALMQRANAAYAKEDLLALLSLQLEIEQIDHAHLQRASDQQLQHFNAVLAEQADELQAELAMRERRFVAEFELRPRRKLDVKKLAPLLADAQADWNAELYQASRDLGSLGSREGLRRWLRKLRAG